MNFQEIDKCFTWFLCKLLWYYDIIYDVCGLIMSNFFISIDLANKFLKIKKKFLVYNFWIWRQFDNVYYHNGLQKYTILNIAMNEKD